jgi:hypothetical protein
MSKTNTAETNESPSEATHASVQLTRSVDVNGASHLAGTLLGNLPIATARNLVAQNAATIISTSTAATKPRKSGIEHEIPSGLGLDGNVWEAACPVQGQRSSVFVNTQELEALRNG